RPTVQSDQSGRAVDDRPRATGSLQTVARFSPSRSVRLLHRVPCHAPEAALESRPHLRERLLFLKVVMLELQRITVFPDRADHVLREPARQLRLDLQRDFDLGL